MSITPPNINKNSPTSGKTVPPDESNLTLGEWAKLANIALAELMKSGLERPAVDSRPTQEMPTWVFDNNFEGMPPFDPTAELTRMAAEMDEILADVERLPPPNTGGNRSITDQEVDEWDDGLKALMHDSKLQDQSTASNPKKRNQSGGGQK